MFFDGDFARRTVLQIAISRGYCAMAPVIIYLLE